MERRKMVKVEVIRNGGQVEQMSTDDPKLLGEWIIYTAHKMPANERSMRGNWHVGAWELDA